MSQISLLQNKSENLRRLISYEVGSSTMELINDLVETEIELELLSNK